MREIDNRYPEFAAPYEPIRGGKHKKRLDFARMVLMIVGALLAASVFFRMPEPEPEPQVIAVVTPAATAEPAPPSTPSPTVTPSPAPQPTVTPYVRPIPPYYRPVTPDPHPSEQPAGPTASPTSTPTTEPEKKHRATVLILGNTGTMAYTGEQISFYGYTYEVYEDSDTAGDSGAVTITVNLRDGVDPTLVFGIEPGSYEMNISPADFTVTSDYYTEIEVLVEPGWLEIVDGEQEVNVVIVGNHETVTYDGRPHTVSGFEIQVTDENGDSIDPGMFNVSLIDPATAHVSATAAGNYPMPRNAVEDAELSASDFSVTSDIYTNITVDFTNGYLEIVPAKVTVTITGETDTVVFDDTMHVVQGYSVSIPADTDLTEADIMILDEELASASGVEVGRHPMNLQPDYFECLNDNYEVEFEIVDGWLEIAASRTAHITITGNSKTVTYDGTLQSVYGYTYSAVDDTGSQIDSGQISVTMETPSKAGVERTNAGEYGMQGLEEGDFTITLNSSDYNSYEIVEIIPGILTINRAEVTVSVTGKTAEVTYDGSVQTLSGYTYSIPSGSAFDESMISGPAQDAVSVSGTEPGTYELVLNAADFSSSSPNHDVTFNVTNGQLVINPASTSHTAPTFQISNEMSILLADDGGLDIWPAFEISQWNDLENGTLTATPYISDATGGYTAGTGRTITQGSDFEYTDGDYAEVQGHLAYQDGAVYNIKIVLDYTYPDGTTGSSEIGPVTIHTENFASLSPNFGTGGVDIDSSGFLVVEVLIDETNVETDNVKPGYYTTPVMVNGNEATGSSSGQVWLMRFPGTNRLQMSLNPGDVTRPARVNGRLMLYEQTGPIYWISVVNIDKTVE